MKTNSKNFTRNEIIEDALNKGLTKIEITYGINGYPERLGDYGVIGFKTFEDAEKFAEENGCKVALFKQKAGWHFWENIGSAFEPLTADQYIEDLGDNYSMANTWEEEKEFIIDRLKDIADDFDGDFDKIKSYIERMEVIKEELDKAGDDEVVIIGYGEYCETVPKTMMGYSEDVTSYSIGVLISYDDFSDESED